MALSKGKKPKDISSLSRGELRGHARNRIQEAFRGMLRKFLKVPDRISYVTIKAEWSEFVKWQQVYKTGTISSTSKSATYQNPYELVVSSYKYLSDLEKTFGESVTLQVRGKFPDDFSNKRAWQFSRLTALRDIVSRHLTPYIETFLLHGSYASGDYIEGWSDVDTLVVLNDKSFRDASTLKLVKGELQKAELLLYAIDPLSHHGFMVATSYDLENYSVSLLPSEAVGKSLVMLGTGKLTLNIRDDVFERRDAVLQINEYFAGKVARGDYSTNRFGWKKDLSLMMLWPALVLQAEGRNVDKKMSFEQFRNKYPSHASVDEASKMRHLWRRVNLLRFYPAVFFKTLPFWLNNLVVRLHAKLSAKARVDNFDYVKTLTRSFTAMAQAQVEEI